MNAQEARQLTNSANKQVNLQPLLKYVLEQIEAAAKLGRSSISDPHTNGRIPVECQNPEVERALWLELQNLGYEVVHHTDPDPTYLYFDNPVYQYRGHPCSRPYTTVSW